MIIELPVSGSTYLYLVLYKNTKIVTMRKEPEVLHQESKRDIWPFGGGVG